ncbi:MAG: phosphoribosylglycinamide formyltransferase [Elainellaceae cyanobacterium]
MTDRVVEEAHQGIDCESDTVILSPPISPQLWQMHRQSPPLRLGVMASGTGSNFSAIAQAIEEGRLNAQIQVVIYNNPDAGVVQRAQQKNIATCLLNHREFETRESLDQAIVDTLYHHQVDWVIMAGWMRRVTNVLIDAYRDRVINIHPSLLPSFPGIHAVEQALAAGVAIAGCTVHHVVLEVDSGPILMQAAVPVFPDDTSDSLHQRIHRQEHQIYPLAIVLASGKAALAVLDG